MKCYERPRKGCRKFQIITHSLGTITANKSVPITMAKRVREAEALRSDPLNSPVLPVCTTSLLDGGGVGACGCGVELGAGVGVALCGVGDGESVDLGGVGAGVRASSSETPAEVAAFVQVDVSSFVKAVMDAPSTATP